jgi:CelD/BcsL family acetyltransferase involved in cellulose biosynthesis
MAAGGFAAGAPLTPSTAAAQDRPDSPWNRAAMAVEHGDPLCCRTEWQLSALETMHAAHPTAIHVGGNAVLAFAWLPSAEFGRILGPCEASWCYGCPLLGHGAVDLLVSWLDALARRGRRPAVAVTGLAPGSPTLRAVEALPDHDCFEAGEEREQCSASLAGGLDGYLSRRTPHFRRHVRQQQRRARELGVALERVAPADAAAAAAAYARMLAVEARSWKGRDGCGMDCEPARAFYGRMLARLAAGGNARAVFAVRDGVDLGYLFGGCVDGVFRGQQFSYDQAWAHASLGNVMQLEQLAWLAEAGARRYDLGPMMPYKARWAEQRVLLQMRLLVPV